MLDPSILFLSGVISKKKVHFYLQVTLTLNLISCRSGQETIEKDFYQNQSFSFCVISLTNKQTNQQTDMAEKRTSSNLAEVKMHDSQHVRSQIE